MSTIWFDVDDCLTDTAPVIAQSMRRLTGIEMEPADWSHLNLLELYQLGPKDMDRVRDFWRKDELLERVEIFPHAKETLLVLHEAGYKIGLITARGWHPHGEQITRNWASSHHLPIEQVILTTIDQSKSECLKKIKTNVAGFVDDSAVNVHSADKEGWPSVLLTRPWNANWPGNLERISDIQEFPDWLNHVVCKPSRTNTKKWGQL